MRYAIIENNLVTNVVELNNASEWNGLAIQSDIADIGDSYDGTAIIAKPVIIAPITWQQHQSQAQSLLNKSDFVAIRCLKAGIVFPTTWQTYVSALRAIIGASTGDATQSLPTQPAYPTGS